MTRLATIVAFVILALPIQARSHSWYTELQRRDGGGSCCSDSDCHPVGECVLGDGKGGLAIEGRCLEIPRNKVLGLPSPDGMTHACWVHMNGEPSILCVILGGQT